jgi:2-methylcitrate dehydratase PrpD
MRSTVRSGPATISERLAEYITTLRFDDLPAEVVEKTKDHLGFHITLALGGHGARAGATATKLAEELSGDDGRSTVIGRRRLAHALDAAFANSALMATGHLDDTTEPSGVHPGVVVHPAGWAIAEERHVSGRELITAVSLGYDVMAKLADPIGTLGSYGRRPQYPFAPFGVAATAARLLGLDYERTVQALGHAGHAGMGVVEGTEHNWHLDARIARNGMFCAYLAQAGALTARTTIEGEHGFYVAFYGNVPAGLSASLDTLGHEFAISQSTTKEFSASGSNIVSMQLAHELRTAHRIDPMKIVTVRVVLSEERRGRDMYFESELDKPDATPANAKNSLRFRIAAILLDGRIDVDRCDAFRADDTQKMLSKVKLEYEPGPRIRVGLIDAANTANGRVEIHMSDGRVLSLSRERYMAPPGHWRPWLYRDGGALLPPTQVERLDGMLSHLEHVDDAADVMALLRIGAARRDA